MGILDFLRKSTPPPGLANADKKIANLARVVGDKRAQTYDRLDAIQTLSNMKTPDAAAALLRRFTISIDPSITDQEEKELAYQGIVATGLEDDLPKDEAERDKALERLRERREGLFEAIRDYCTRAEQLTWPLKVLRELLPDEAYAEELCKLLGRFDTEYVRNVDPKVQIIVALEDVKVSEVCVAVEPYLDDANETVRFHAVNTVFAQDSESVIPTLIKVIENEESTRIKNKVAEGIIRHGWTIPADLRKAASAALADSDGYTVEPSGKVLRG